MPLLRASNSPLLTGKEKSYLTANASAGDSTVTIADYAQVTTGKYVLIGDLGQEGSEVIRIHTSTAPTSAGVVTLNSVLIYPHSMNDPIVVIDFNQVEFSRATTTTGSKSILSTTDIEADDLFTVYNDTTNSTGYGFVRYKNSATTTYSSYSGPLPYSGMARNSVRYMKDRGLALAGEQISSLISEDFLLQELNNWQDDITRQKDWDFELESATDTVVAGQKTYSFPTSPYAFKYQDTDRSILQIRLKNLRRLSKLDKREYDELMIGTISTTLASDISATADGTDVVLTNSNDFAESGTILIGDGSADEIDYTSNDETTGTLDGTTNISTTHTSGATVWQTLSLACPRAYMAYNDLIYLYPVASSTEHGYTIYYDYWKKIPDLVNDTDTTVIPFYGLAEYFLAWKIETRKGNQDAGDRWRQLYESRLAGEIRRNRPEQNFSFKVWH